MNNFSLQVKVVFQGDLSHPISISCLFFSINRNPPVAFVANDTESLLAEVHFTNVHLRWLFEGRRKEVGLLIPDFPKCYTALM